MGDEENSFAQVPQRPLHGVSGIDVGGLITGLAMVAQHAAGLFLDSNLGTPTEEGGLEGVAGVQGRLFCINASLNGGFA